MQQSAAPRHRCLLLDLVREMGIDRGGGRGTMPEPDLDHPQVHAGLEQVRAQE